MSSFEEAEPHEEKVPTRKDPQTNDKISDRKVPPDDEDDQSPTKKVASTKKESKKRKWRKPKDMPKRPLSAYNIFFAHERQEIIKASGFDGELVGGGSPKKKMGFAGLARSVAAKWKTLDPTMKKQYEAMAGKEQERYKLAVVEWKRAQEERKTQEQLFQAQFEAARGGAGSASLAQLQAARRVSDTFLHQQGYSSSSVNPMMTAGQPSRNALSADDLSSLLLSQRPSWPAMPQTIASLGSIYDGSSATEQHRSTMNLNFPATATATASGAATNRASMEDFSAPNTMFPPGDPQNQQQMEFLLGSFNSGPQPTPFDSAILPATQQARQNPVRGSDHHSADVAFLPPRGLQQQQQQPSEAHGSELQHTENVASRHRINDLASQLDDEAFDFLSSLGNNPGQGR